MGIAFCPLHKEKQERAARLAIKVSEREQIGIDEAWTRVWMKAFGMMLSDIVRGCGGELERQEKGIRNEGESGGRQTP